MQTILIYSFFILSIAEYSRDDAVNYALDNYNKINHTCGNDDSDHKKCNPFSYYGKEFCDYKGDGGDCANFVSQCLVFGGGHEYLNGGTDFCRGECGFFEIGAQKLGKCLLSKGWNSTCDNLMEPPSYIKPGDVLIYHNNSSDSYQAHAVIITSVEPTVKITGRSELMKDEPYTDSTEKSYYQWLHFIDPVDDYGKPLNSYEYIISINRLEIGYKPCSDTLGLYNFYIYVDVNKDIDYTEELTFDFTTSSNENIKTACTPHNFDYFGFFLCDINICVYPLNNVDIIFPVDPPQSKKFWFKNWKKIIGGSPGISNKISKVNCLPKEKNTFIPTSIKLEGCESKKNIFNIYGNWLYNDKDKIPLFWEFPLLLLNGENSIAYCKYQSSYTISIKCELDGYGKIKFDEAYAVGLLEVFKINKFSSDIILNPCSSGDKLQNLVYHSLQYIIIFIILLF